MASSSSSYEAPEPPPLDFLIDVAARPRLTLIQYSVKAWLKIPSSFRVLESVSFESALQCLRSWNHVCPMALENRAGVRVLALSGPSSRLREVPTAIAIGQLKSDRLHIWTLAHSPEVPPSLQGQLLSKICRQAHIWGAREVLFYSDKGRKDPICRGGVILRELEISAGDSLWIP